MTAEEARTAPLTSEELAAERPMDHPQYSGE